jgi:uncharacterized protein YecE (DUF72 family)
VYRSWREHLYQGIPVSRWLTTAAATFDTLEVNGSFYVQIARDTYQRWHDQTPPGFRFAVKAHRFVTHYKRLVGVEKSIVLLRDQASGLGDKLHSVIWQLPAHIAADPPRLDRFLDMLAEWPGPRHAMELRHRSWFNDEVAGILADHGVANAMGDAPDFPMWREVTTDLVYVRLHGHTRKYASSYSSAHIKKWADDARRWNAEGRDVHIYFDNDAEGAAVRNALCLKAELAAQPRARSRQAAAY